MGYNKIVITGSVLELYEYEKDLPERVRGIRKEREKSHDHADLENGRKDTLSGGFVGRRPDHARRARMAFRRLVASNLGGSVPPVLVTLTYAENIGDLRSGYHSLTSFIKALRRQVGEDFRYVAVPEFQERGAVHFHALFWGLSSQLFLEERRTRFLAQLWGQGFIFFKTTDGDRKLSNYLSKYMAKAFLDFRLRNQKAYVASRNIKRPIVYSAISPIWPILEDRGCVDNLPLQEKVYSTQWLGKGRYRSYEIQN